MHLDLLQGPSSLIVTMAASPYMDTGLFLAAGEAVDGGPVALLLHLTAYCAATGDVLHFSNTDGPSETLGSGSQLTTGDRWLWPDRIPSVLSREPEFLCLKVYAVTDN